MAGGGGDKGSGNTNLWMLTFADLLSLVLAFFVLLYSTQQVENSKWKNLSSSLSEHFSPNKDHNAIQATPKALSQIDEPVAINLDYLQAVISEKFESIPEFTEKRIRRFDDRLAISFSGDGVFVGDDHQLSEDVKSELDKLSSVLGSIGNRIEIVSYTDKDSIPLGQEPWRYTLRRADTVANEIKRAGYPYAVAAFGVGDSRNKSGKDVKAQGGASADANRVEVVVRETTVTE